MSVRPTNFVRRLRGLSPVGKAVAFVMADHADHRTGECYMSMQTLADEAGLQWADTAAKAVKRLVASGMLDTPHGVSRGGRSKAGRGKTTVYRFTFTVNCDSGITIEPYTTPTRQSELTPTLQSQLKPSTPTPTPTLTPTGESDGGFKGLRV